MHIMIIILKDQFSATGLNKNSVHVSSQLSDLVSNELVDFSKLLDSTYLGVKHNPCDQNSFTYTQQKMDTTTNLISPSEYMQDLKTSYNCPAEFEMKKMEKTKHREEAVDETSIVKRFLSVYNNHYNGYTSDGDKDIQPDKVKVSENGALLSEVLEPDAENSLGRQIRFETVNVQPQIRNLRFRHICSKLNEKMSFSPLELSGSSKTVFSTEAHDLQNDRTNRKGKRLRRSTDTQSIVFAKDIAGHRWDEDIDSLLAFINSSDQNLERVAAENINSLENVDLLPKSSVHKVQDTKKYKVLSKEGKNGPNCKPKINCEKSSEDHRTCVSSGNENLSDSIGRIQDEASRKSKTCGTSFGNFNLEKVPKSKSVDNTSSFIPGSIFESEHQGGIKTGMTDSNIITSNSNEAVLIHNNIQSDFVEDFYSITEAVYDYVEETEFKVVMKKKKHKNKHLPKKSCDVSQKCSCTSEIKKQYPDKLAKQASRNDLVLKLPIQPRGRRDGSHQKSFSSVPPSEHSSSENSDLDSVHSLPVWGSGPPPTFSYPHTTHSSFSCTPRASYADIVCKSVNPSESKSRLYGSLTDRDMKSGVSQPSLQKKFGVDSKLFENGHCLIPNNQPHTITEEGCISSGIACSKANLHSKYSDLYNSGISETGLITNNGNSHVLEGNPNLCNHPTTDESVTSNSTIGNELVISNQPEQEKVAANIPGQQTKNRSECPPVIIMDNYIPKGCVCDISFGFEVNEQLLCTTLGNNYSKVTKRLNSDLRIPSAVCTAIPDNVVGSLSFSSIILPDSSVNDELCEDLKCNKVVTHLDHSIKWQDSTLDVDTFNYNQIVNFFGSTWKKALNDYQQGSKNSNKASKVRFYTEQ